MSLTHRTTEERAAREELSAAFGETLSDAEWEDVRANLLAVFGVLVEWQYADDDARTDECEGAARR